jgi:hypothetical protein
LTRALAQRHESTCNENWSLYLSNWEVLKVLNKYPGNESMCHRCWHSGLCAPYPMMKMLTAP